MKIGVPKEIKVHEYRVGLVPAGVRELVNAGHSVTVQTGAGSGIGFGDTDYKAAGASIAANAGDVFAGVLAAGWHSGPHRAIRRACAAAALATLVQGAGDCAPTRDAIAGAESNATVTKCE